MGDMTATQGMQDYGQLSQDPVMGSTDLFGGSTYDPVTGSGTFGSGSGLPPGYDPVTGQVTDPTGLGSGAGSSLPPGYNPVTGATSAPTGLNDPNLNLQTLLASFGSGSTPSSSGSSASNWLSNFLSGNPANGGLSGLAPYLAAGAGGIAMAKSAQNQATDEANKLAALGQPYTDAGKALLTQFQGGKLRPDQQAVVDTSAAAGNQLITAATPLGQIAQQAFADYNSGKLNAADQVQLDQQTAAQKQAVRQQLASAGISDSSVLSAQDQQIDNQAMITKQKLLDARFATGNQAYDQWLTSTTEGQQLKLQGQQFATTSFESMLNDSLGLAAEGMQPAMQAIQLKIQSDAELSQTVSQLLGTLASAYSYAAAGPKTVVGGTGGAVSGSPGGGGSSNNIGQIISGVGSLASTVGTVGKLFGFSGASGQAATGAGSAGAAAGAIGNTARGGAFGTGGSLANGVGLDDVAGLAGAAYTLAVPQGKFAGTISGAESGASLFGWPGAIIGGAAGYLRNGGWTDANPIKASGFTGTTMDQAWKDQNIARLASNPAASVASKLGVSSNSTWGKILDPGSAISGLFSGPDKAGDAWKSYSSSGATSVPGTQVPTHDFEEALFGAWQHNQDALSTFTNMDYRPGPRGDQGHGGDAEQYKGWLEQTLAQATSSGKITPGMTGAQVFGQIVAPAMDQYWKSTGSDMRMSTWQTQYPQMEGLFRQLTERAMSGQSIGRAADTTDYGGLGYQNVPTLSQDIQQLSQMGSGQKTTQPVMGGTA